MLSIVKRLLPLLLRAFPNVCARRRDLHADAERFREEIRKTRYVGVESRNSDPFLVVSRIIPESVQQDGKTARAFELRIWFHYDSGSR